MTRVGTHLLRSALQCSLLIYLRCTTDFLKVVMWPWSVAVALPRVLASLLLDTCCPWLCNQPSPVFLIFPSYGSFEVSLGCVSKCWLAKAGKKNDAKILEDFKYRVEYPSVHFDSESSSDIRKLFESFEYFSNTFTIAPLVRWASQNVQGCWLYETWPQHYIHWYRILKLFTVNTGCL